MSVTTGTLSARVSFLRTPMTRSIVGTSISGILQEPRNGLLEKLFQPERLFEKNDVSERLDLVAQLGGRVAGHEDHGKLRAKRPHRFDEGETVDLGHAHVRDEKLIVV